MCIQGADPSVWARPEATVILPAPSATPAPGLWDVARAAASLLFSVPAAALLFVGFGLYWVAVRVRGRARP
jgi:hypothetical protein